MPTQRVDAHLDLRKNELQNAVIQKLSAAPSSPTDGQIYYDTTLNQFGSRQNGAWVYLAVAGTDQNAVKDIVGGMLAPGDVITGSYNSGTKVLTLSIGAGKVSNAMLASGISADKIVDGSTNAYYTLAERTKLSGVATNATNYTDTNARANRLDQFAAPTASVSFNSQNITNLLDPTAAQHAATKGYTDSAISTARSFAIARANHTGTQPASTISDFDTQVRTSRLDQMAAPTSAVSFNSQRITAVATPTAGTDAANKDYVDQASAAAAAGLDPKPSVRTVSTTNVSLSSPGTTIGGVTMAANDRVLLAGQTTGSENGIYVWTASGAALTRATDSNTSAKVTSGLITYVSEGTNAGQQWVLTTADPITLGTTALVFSQYTGASTTTAGAGLYASGGNTFNVGQGNGIIADADAVRVDPAVVVRKFAQTIGDGSAVNFTITHNLGTQDVTVAIRDTSTNELTLVQTVVTSANVVTVSFNTAPASGAYRVTVQG